MTVAACPPVPDPAVRGIVVFDPTEFKAAYPAFATVADGLLEGDFAVAEMFLNNSCCSVVRDANRRQLLLYMVTAHVAYLLQGENGKPPSGIVGRINQATEGSVSVGAAYVNDMSMTEAYFSQSPYGVMFWTATANYRSFHYVAPPQSGCFGRGPGFYGPGFGRGPGSNCC